MKVKAKLDLAGIKTWLLEHGEKLALGVVAIVVVLFIYSAIQREALEASMQPQPLSDLAGNVRQHVTNSQWDEKREEVQLVDYTARAKSEPVKLGTFALPNPLDPPVFDPKAKRDEPVVVAVEELRVGAGYDVIKEKADGGGGRGAEAQLKAQPWAVVTAVVPVKRQQEEYDKAFSQAVNFDPKRDVPRYAEPLLERTDVDGANPDKVEWKEVPRASKFKERWAGRSEEIVSAEYVDDMLTAELAPLANSDQKWGETVAHPKTRRKGRERADEGAEAQQDAPANDAGQQKDERFRFDRAKSQPPPKTDRAKRDEPEEVEYRLLRAFDYTVQPGKKYRYRVTIALDNPNYNLPVQYLKDPESAGRRGLVSKPSEPTAVVAIPDGHRVLAGAVDSGSRYAEPTATLLVTAIDAREGLEAATEMTKVYRGTVANTAQRTVKVRHPISKQTDDVTLGFQSNILVLDIYGGRDLPGRSRPALVTPGEILLMDAEGNLMVRSELDDRAQYDSSIVREVVEPRKKDALLDDGKPKRRARSR